MSTEINETRMDELEGLSGEELLEWVVMTVEAVGGKIHLKEIAQVPAETEEGAITKVAEANPSKASQRMCALVAGTVRGRRVEITHFARIVE